MRYIRKRKIHRIIYLWSAVLFILLFCSNLNVYGQDNEASIQDSINTLPNFKVQLLYNVPKESQGSWVALTVDPKGRIYASDQQDRGIYRITVNGTQDKPKVDVKKIVMPLSGAQGLKWAYGHLYADVNGVGIYRLTDTNGNDTLNKMDFLGGPAMRGEHGNHALIRTEDREGLYFIAGDFTPLPKHYESSRLESWDEDLLLPRIWDARGFSRGLMAPGGYIARIDPNANDWEIISTGFRNAYDVAMNQDGELFSYDNDMEWDMGSPWYRPTRIVHVTSGSDWGWRSGSGKWPTYYEDSEPPVVNIGPGAPVGLLFGTGAKFPAKYQRAMYALDWTFGTMRAIHLTPKGSSYTADVEEFISGKQSALPLTDAVIGKDGAMYFVTGGRNLDSKLFRVIYTGDKSTAPAEPVHDPKARAARQVRHELESFHGHQDPDAIDVAWPYLASKDRQIRYAARVAIEAQPVEQWAQKALDENRPQARITGLVALARMGSDSYHDAAIKSLMEMNIGKLSPDEKLGYLRAFALVFIRLGEPNEQQRTQISDKLEKYLPGKDDRVNTELVRDLVYLKDSRVIGKTLSLMRDMKPQPPEWGDLLTRNKRYGGTIKKMVENPPPTNKLKYVFMLRNLRNGWTIKQRREYFTIINDAAGQLGGASYSGFLTNIRDEALSNCSDKEREAVADITGVSLSKQPDFKIHSPEGPGRNWTLEEATKLVVDSLDYGRNYKDGRNAFFAVGCNSCHQFNGYGGNIGPNLQTIGQRFNGADILEAIIHPSAMISDQYSSSKVTLKNGNTTTGRVIRTNSQVKVYPPDVKAEPKIFSNDEVESIKQVDVSQMPPGLINSLNPEELRDLVAYLESGGDPKSDMFKTKAELEKEKKDNKGK